MRSDLFLDDVPDPFVFPVVDDDCRDLDDLIKVQDEVDDHDREVEDEGREEA